MLDFARLVLRPAMTTFARPVTVTPLASQPGVPAYPAQGIWSSKPVDVQVEDGILSSQVHTLDIRAIDFAVQIRQGDKIFIPACKSLPQIGTCLVEDSDYDGQGGVLLTLKIIAP